MPSTLQSPLSGTLKATRSVISSEDMRGGSEAQQTLIPQQLAAQAEQIRGLNEQFESLLSVQEQKNKEIEEFKDKFFEQSALLERRQKLAEELQRKKDAAEARAAGEQKIEGGLTRTMMKPVQKIKEQMGSILDKALGFFGWLFGGWLANQLLDMIKAWKTGDWDLMKKVNTTTKGVLASLSAGLTTVNAALKGISKLIRSGVRGTFNFFNNLRKNGWKQITQTLKNARSGGMNFLRNTAGKLSGGKGIFGFGKSSRGVPWMSPSGTSTLNIGKTLNKPSANVNIKPGQFKAPSITPQNVVPKTSVVPKAPRFSGIKNLMPLASKILTVLGGFLDFMDGDWVDLGVLLISGIAGIVAASAAAPVVATVAGIVAAITGIVYTYEKIAEMLKGWGINFLPEILPEAGVNMWKALGKKDDDPSTRAAWDFLGWAGTGKKKNEVNGDNVSSIKNDTVDKIGEDPNKDNIEVVYVDMSDAGVGSKGSSGGGNDSVADVTPSVSAENETNNNRLFAQVQSGVVGV